jgi:metal-responsive CopG/Arc/MetJ family transcriptional regulator
MYVHDGQGAMEEKSERFEMRVQASFLKRLDSWRREQDDLPSRAEAIRRLVEQALDSKSKKKP